MNGQTMDNTRDRRQAKWDRLTELIGKAESQGLRAFTTDELREFSRLYRSTTSDLSLARARNRQELALYLNQLVARTHAQIYSRPPRRKPELLAFFARTVPETFRDCFGFWLASLAVLLVGCALGYAATSRDPAWSEVFVGRGMRDALEGFLKKNTVPGQYFADTQGLFGGGGFSSLLMVNNIQVALMCFAFGISAGAGTLYVAWRNALMLGAALGLGAFHQKLVLMTAVVAPHGVVEISAIIVSAAAGFRLGWALISPGDRLRRDALREAGKQAGVLALGTIPMFVFAGLVEGLVSPIHTGPLAAIPFRLGFGLFSGVVLYGWLFSGFLRRRDG
jgi:uncharacterized membrane protein SpoIIM required for sporulation